MKKSVLFASAFNSVAKSSVVKSFKDAIRAGVRVAACYSVALLLVSAIEKGVSMVKNMKPENNWDEGVSEEEWSDEFENMPLDRDVEE